MATEKRLIDASALKAVFDERYDDAFMQSHTRPNIAYWEGYASGANWGRNTIADAPTVDAVEVVHGRWVEKPYLLGTTRYCSICGQNYGMPHGVFNYCPNCGAKMDGGVDRGL